MEAAHAWYSSRSGLTPASFYTIDDHQYAFYADRSGLLPRLSFTVSDHMRAYFELVTGTTGSLTSMKLQHYRALSGLPNAGVMEATNAVFSNYATRQTNLATNPSFESAVAGTTVVRTNLVANPSFETGFSFWTVSRAGIATDSTRKAVGAQSLKATVTDDTNASYVIGSATNGERVPVLGGAVNTMSVWVASTEASSYEVQVYEYDAANALILPVQKQTLAAFAANEERRVGFTFTTYAGTASLRPVVLRNTSPVGATFWVDAFLVEQTDQLRPYFDGGTPDALGFDYGWTGVANASTSTAKASAVTVRTNACTNPAFEVGTTGWGANSGNIVASRDTTVKRAGVASLKAEVTTQVVGDVNTFGSMVTVVAGQTWTASAYLSISAVRTMRVTLEYRDSGNGTVGTAIGTLTPAADGSFNRVSATMVAPANAVSMFARVGVDAAAPAGFIWWTDEVLFEQSPVVGSYFDGSTPSAGDFINSWTGAANASASAQSGVSVADSIPSAASSVSSAGALRVIPTGSTNDSFAYVGGGLGAFRLGMVAGKTYTALATITLAAPQTGSLNGTARSIKPFWKTAGGSYVSVDVRAVNAAGSTELRVTWTIPSDATEAFVRLYNGATLGNGDVYFDDFLLIEGTYTGPYFDGDTADDEYLHVWNGVAHASASSRT